MKRHECRPKEVNEQMSNLVWKGEEWGTPEAVTLQVAVAQRDDALFGDSEHNTEYQVTLLLTLATGLDRKSVV